MRSIRDLWSVSGRLAASVLAVGVLAAACSSGSTSNTSSAVSSAAAAASSAVSSAAAAASSRLSSAAPAVSSALSSAASAGSSKLSSAESALSSAAGSLQSAASSKAASASSAVSSAVAAAIGPATVATNTGKLGTFLVDENGRTLYLYLADTAGKSTCYDACAVAWPPLLTKGAPSASGEADKSLLSTVARNGGASMVKYGDWPLYYFANDTRRGDTTGQGVQNVWYVVGVDGQPIK